VVESFVPDTMPMLKETGYTDKVINLFGSLYYKNDAKLQEALAAEEKFLLKEKLYRHRKVLCSFFHFSCEQRCREDK
jgi:hypothetical protein